MSRIASDGPVVKRVEDSQGAGLRSVAASTLRPGEDSSKLRLSSLLGNIENNLPPPLTAEKQAELHLTPRRELHYNLKPTAALLLNNRYVDGCMRVPLNTFSAVEVRASPSGLVYLHGLRRCGLLWACPLCGSKISQHRANELAAALTRWEESGGVSAMVTYTLQHDASMCLCDLLGVVLACQEAFHSGSPYRRLEGRYGLVGRITALEVTHGLTNGWHVHVHELLLLAGAVNYWQLQQDYLRRWQSMLGRFGYACNSHGVDVVPGDRAKAEYLARYVSKFATPDELRGLPPGDWGLAQELALAASKLARRGGRTPLQLLLDAHMGDQVAGQLYQEYGAAFFDKRHLRMSKGTRDLLGLVNRSDEEIANSGGEGRVLRLISSPEWIKGNYGNKPVEVLRSVIGGA